MLPVGLIQPMPRPDRILEDIAMDFIESDTIDLGGCLENLEFY